MYKRNKIDENDDLITIHRKNDIRKKPTGPVNKIINFYEVIPKKYLNNTENHNYELHFIDLPFRMCVVAPSGSGKTNFLLNMIRVFSYGKGTFTDITIITANKDEALYNWLEGQSDNIRILEGLENNPKLDDYEKDSNHLLIWDDLVLEKNLKPVEKYYIRARKRNVSVVFLSQSYVDIPKMIRKNSNYLVLFDLGGSKRETDYILREWSGELENYQLRAIYNDATFEDLHPLIIKGGKNKDKNKKYRKGFDNFYNLDEFLKNIPKPVKRLMSRTRKIKKQYSSDSSDSSDSD